MWVWGCFGEKVSWPAADTGVDVIEKTTVVTEKRHPKTSASCWRRLGALLPWITLDNRGRTDDSSGDISTQGPNSDVSRSLLDIRGLRQSWPDQAEDLFRIESLSWMPGQHIWLQGANGSGKTTLMRLISGLEAIQEGVIHLSGASGSNVDEDGLRICYLHQSPYLFAGSVERNLNFVIRSIRAKKRPAAREALELGLQLAGLESLRDQDAVTLSGGERQRLALLRAWLLEPGLLLLDEPAANLDDDSIELMHRLVTDLIDKGTVIMVSSHQKNLLTDLCNTRWNIQSGTLAASRIET